MCWSKLRKTCIMLMVDLSKWRDEGGNCCWFHTELTNLVKITNNVMLKHKSNLFTDQQCKFTTKCLYNIKKSKKKKNATEVDRE